MFELFFCRSGNLFSVNELSMRQLVEAMLNSGSVFYVGR
ncbi:MAG TPA: hypothetical protein DEB17_00035 [Chlorobaculum sp.]|uniref:Uncharacterized protein n=1 Tax=Chlorobaculum tepidum (strain ATCC 49652 / DSM 12025 / NBRC 103806 / TLS) TaxID=194439 RepID=Q8KC93_CHLTE|nr:hypothetical protein CT1532 [Chlorobaculum tepidum TLS]HBU22387.1 hypothetical protein [Chlorobaculum sp.]